MNSNEKDVKKHILPQRIRTRDLVMAALFAALCFGTTLLSVPLPVVGYGNLGDCLVILSGWLLGPVWGAVAAGMGTALADVSLGFGVYAPATFVIKAVMAIVVWLLARKLGARCRCAWQNVLLCVVAAVVAETVMVGGYFIYECFLYGIATAIGSLVGNGMQATVGLILSSALMLLFRGSKLMNRFFEGNK